MNDSDRRCQARTLGADLGRAARGSRRGHALRIGAAILLAAPLVAAAARAQDSTATPASNAPAPNAPTAPSPASLQSESRLPHREERDIAHARQFEEGTREAQFKVSGPPAEAPTFSVAPGLYAGPQKVAIADETPSAVIYFTFDGTMPIDSWLRYGGPITIARTSTILAVAVAPMHAASKVVVAAYALSSPPDTSPSPTTR